jgi:hypothetical protein
MTQMMTSSRSLASLLMIKFEMDGFLVFTFASGVGDWFFVLSFSNVLDPALPDEFFQIRQI